MTALAAGHTPADIDGMSLRDLQLLAIARANSGPL